MKRRVRQELAQGHTTKKGRDRRADCRLPKQGSPPTSPRAQDPQVQEPERRRTRVHHASRYARQGQENDDQDRTQSADPIGEHSSPGPREVGSARGVSAPPKKREQ